MTDARYEPLVAPEVLAGNPASLTQGPWRGIPIIGAVIAARQWSEHYAPTIARIGDALRARPQPPDELWGESPARLRLARWLCATIAARIHWPNDHFIPDDPCSVLFWAHVDGMDETRLLNAIEAGLSVKFGRGEIETWMNLTLGELVDVLLRGKVASDQWPPPPDRIIVIPPTSEGGGGIKKR